MNVLTATEKDVFKTVSWANGDMAMAARALEMPTDTTAEVFESARVKMVIAIHGEPDKSWKSIYALAQALGVDDGTVAKAVEPYRNTRIWCLAGTRKWAWRFPPLVVEAVSRPHREKAKIPAAGDYLTLQRLRQASGMGELRIKQILKEQGVEPELRRDLTNRVRPHYPPIAVEILRKYHIPKAGDWYTVSGMAGILGCPRSEVQARLANTDFRREIRYSRGYNKPTTHYEPAALEYLRGVIRVAPPAGDWLTALQAAVLLKRDRQRFSKRLQQAGLPYEDRRDRRNVVRRHYSPETIERIRTGEIEI